MLPHPLRADVNHHCLRFTHGRYLKVACEELRLQAQYGIGGAGVSDTINQLADDVAGTLDVVLARVERDYAKWARDTGGAVAIGAKNNATVRDLLCMLLVSRRGLRQDDLVELLAPAGDIALPVAAATRLFRAVSVYVKALGHSSLLGLAHQQMALAVENRYFGGSEGEAVKARAIDRMVSRLRARIDPSGAGMWVAKPDSAYDDICFYYTQ